MRRHLSQYSNEIGSMIICPAVVPLGFRDKQKRKKNRQKAKKEKDVWLVLDTRSKAPKRRKEIY